MNLFYPRSIISLFIMISFIKTKKINKKKNFLILEKIYFADFVKKNLNINFLNKYFQIIKIISTPETKHKIFRFNYLKLYFFNNYTINKIMKLKLIKNLLKIKYKNFYGSGSFLDEVFYKNNKYAKFYFVEHGVGNIYNFTNYNILKLVINKFIRNLLDFIFSNTTIRYYGYLGILNKNFSKNIYINQTKIKKNISPNLFKFKKILDEYYINNTKTHFLKKKIKKNYILFNWNFIIRPNSNVIKQIIKNQKIDINNDILLIKCHNKSMYNNKKNYFNLIKFLKENKIKFYEINHKFSFIPLEYLIYHFNIKKIISLMSSTPFFSSIIFPKNKIYLYYYLNYQFGKNFYSPEHTNLALRIYKKNFKNITFY